MLNLLVRLLVIAFVGICYVALDWTLGTWASTAWIVCLGGPLFAAAMEA